MYTMGDHKRSESSLFRGVGSLLLRVAVYMRMWVLVLLWLYTMLSVQGIRRDLVKQYTKEASLLLELETVA